MTKDKRERTNKDLLHEGRENTFLDIDRMINEGMAGGSVHMREGFTNIEEARDLYEEEPPFNTTD